MDSSLDYFREAAAQAEGELRAAQEALIRALHTRTEALERHCAGPPGEEPGTDETSCDDATSLAALEAQVRELTQRRDDAASTCGWYVARARGRAVGAAAANGTSWSGAVTTSGTPTGGDAASPLMNILWVARWSDALLCDPDGAVGRITDALQEMLRTHERDGITGAISVFRGWFAAYAEGPEHSLHPQIAALRTAPLMQQWTALAVNGATLPERAAGPAARMLPDDALSVRWELDVGTTAPLYDPEAPLLEALVARLPLTAFTRAVHPDPFATPAGPWAPGALAAREAKTWEPRRGYYVLAVALYPASQGADGSACEFEVLDATYAALQASLADSADSNIATPWGCGEPTLCHVVLRNHPPQNVLRYAIELPALLEAAAAAVTGADTVRARVAFTWARDDDGPSPRVQVAVDGRCGLLGPGVRELRQMLALDALATESVIFDSHVASRLPEVRAVVTTGHGDTAETTVVPRPLHECVGRHVVELLRPPVSLFVPRGRRGPEPAGNPTAALAGDKRTPRPVAAASAAAASIRADYGGMTSLDRRRSASPPLLVDAPGPESVAATEASRKALEAFRREEAAVAAAFQSFGPDSNGTVSVLDAQDWLMGQAERAGDVAHEALARIHRILRAFGLAGSKAAGTGARLSLEQLAVLHRRLIDG
jgi:hypothetical protein